MRNKADFGSRQQIIFQATCELAGGQPGCDETAIISAAPAAIGKIWDLPEARAPFNG
jgi:hypothetical protein